MFIVIVVELLKLKNILFVDLFSKERKQNLLLDKTD